MKRNRLAGYVIPLAAVLALVGMAYPAWMLGRNGGAWSAPRDGAYSAMVEAASLTGGWTAHSRHATGETVAVTGYLYPMTALPSLLLPRKGPGPVIWLVLLNAGLLAWACGSAARITRVLAPPWMVMPALLAIPLSGPFSGAFFRLDGAGLFAALALALWAAWITLVEGGGRKWGEVAALSVLACLDGPMGGLVAATAALAGTFAGSSVGAVRKRQLKVMLAVLAVVAASLAFHLVDAIHGGFPIMNAGASTGFLVAHLGGLWTGAYVPGPGMVAPLAVLPGAAILFLVALVQPGNLKAAAVLGGAIWVVMLAGAGVLAGSPSVASGPSAALFPFFLLLCISGLQRSVDFVPEQWRKPIGSGIAAAWVLLGLPALAVSIAGIARGAGEITRCRDLADMIPGGGTVITDMPGTVRFCSGRAAAGFGDTEGAFGRGGWGVVYDRYKTVSPDERPRWALLRRVEGGGIPAPTEMLLPVNSSGVFELSEIRWGEPGKVPAIPGWTVVDEVDCGGIESERSHGYIAVGRDRWHRPPVVLSFRGSTGDGGRAVDCFEEFLVTARPGTPMVVIARISSGWPVRLEVSLNGALSDPVPVGRSTDGWQELVVAQPGGALVAERNLVRISCAGAGAGYESFHYWVLQPAGEKGAGMK